MLKGLNLCEYVFVGLKWRFRATALCGGCRSYKNSEGTYRKSIGQQFRDRNSRAACQHAQVYFYNYKNCQSVRNIYWLGKSLLIHIGGSIRMPRVVHIIFGGGVGQYVHIEVKDKCLCGVFRGRTNAS